MHVVEVSQREETVKVNRRNEREIATAFPVFLTFSCFCLKATFSTIHSFNLRMRKQNTLFLLYIKAPFRVLPGNAYTD